MLARSLQRVQARLHPCIGTCRQQCQCASFLRAAHPPQHCHPALQPSTATQHCTMGSRLMVLLFFAQGTVLQVDDFAFARIGDGKRLRDTSICEEVRRHERLSHRLGQACTHACTYLHTFLCTYLMYMPMRMSIHMPVHMNINHDCTRVHTYACLHTCLYTCLHTCLYTCWTDPRAAPPPRRLPCESGSQSAAKTGPPVARAH